MRKIYILTASYCPQCKKLKKELSEKYPDQIEEIKADEEYVRAKKTAKEEIRTIPVICLYEDEKHIITYKAPNIPNVSVLTSWLTTGAFFLGQRWLANEQGEAT